MEDIDRKILLLSEQVQREKLEVEKKYQKEYDELCKKKRDIQLQKSVTFTFNKLVGNKFTYVVNIKPFEVLCYSLKPSDEEKKNLLKQWVDEIKF